MSAYIVDRATIDALVHAAISVRDFGYQWTPDAIGQMLTDANVASVRYRYYRDDDDSLPGPVSAEWKTPYTFPLYESTRWPSPDLGFVFKQLSCFEYQSCERPDWRDSEAFAFCEALRHAYIARVPGYESAPWGCSEYPVK